MRQCRDEYVLPDIAHVYDRIFAAGVAAGRSQAAAELATTFKRIADSERESLVSTPPEYFEEQVRYRSRAVAFARAAEIAEGFDG